MRVITVCAAIASVILELTDIVSPTFWLSDWAFNFMIVLLAINEYDKAIKFDVCVAEKVCKAAACQYFFNALIECCCLFSATNSYRYYYQQH